jgi:hypothetical protein
MAVKAIFSTLDDFYTLSNVEVLSWYACHPDELVRDVHEQVANGKTLSAEYICSRLPEVQKGFAVVPAATAGGVGGPVPPKGQGFVRTRFPSWKKTSKSPTVLVAPPAK